MTAGETPNRPDRFGCGNVALTLFAALAMVLLIFLVIISNPGWRQALQDFFSQQQAQQNSGPGQGNGNGVTDRPIPAVSDRFYDSGDATTAVSGPFSLSDQIAIDPIKSYSQDGLSWISFHDSGDTEILVVFGEPSNSVTVAQGPNVAIGSDDACNFDITVTASSVSGSVACAAAEVMNGSEPSGQTASIQLQFSTTTHPMDTDGAAPGGEPTPEE